MSATSTSIKKQIKRHHTKKQQALNQIPTQINVGIL